jgi:hypothetical protein
MSCLIWFTSKTLTDPDGAVEMVGESEGEVEGYGWVHEYVSQVHNFVHCSDHETNLLIQTGL